MPERDASGRFVSGGGGASPGTVYVPVKPNASGFQKDLGNSVEKSLKKVGGQIKSAGKFMTLGITLPIVGAAVKAVSLAGEFQKTMNTMGAVAEVPKAQLKSLSALALKLGADTVFSANEAGQAMLELAKAGIKPAQIEAGALKNTLDLASAGDLDLANAATVAANAMNTFGLSGAQSRVAVDALAGAANASSADVADLAQGLAQAGANAATAGWSIQETTAALAALANKGIVGSDAGTSLKTLLIGLAPTTDKAKDAVRKLGLEFQNADGTLKGFDEVAGELHDKLGGLTKVQQQVALKTIFGTDAFRAAAILMGTGADKAKKLEAETSKVGNAQDVANAKMSGWAGTLESFKGSLETMLLVIGQQLLPIVTKVVKWLTGLVNGFVKLPGPMKTIILVVGGVLAVLGPLLVVIGSLVVAVGAIGVATLGWIAGIVAVGAALVMAYQKSETFRNIVNGAFQAVLAFAQEMWPKVKAIIEAAMEAIRATVDRVTTIIRWIWKHFGEQITRAVQVAWRTIKGVISGALDIIKGTFQAFSAIMRGDWGALWDAIKSILRGALGIVKSVISGLWDALKNMFAAGIQALKLAWSGLWNGIKSVAKGVWQSVIAAAKAGINGLLSVINGLIQGINDTLEVHIHGPGPIPDVNFDPPDIPLIPMLAKGGIVTKPTLVMAGEVEDEAIVPLSKLHQYGGGGGTPQVVAFRITNWEQGLGEMTLAWRTDDTENDQFRSDLEQMGS